MLIGHSIQLKRAERIDLPTMRRWRTSVEIYQFFSGKDQFSELQQEKWYEKISIGNTDQYFMIQTIQGEDLGVCNISHIDYINRNATWGIYFPKTSRITSYPAEAAILLLDYAFDILNLHKVFSDVLASNHRMLKFGGGLGFKTEGTQREHVFHFGKYVDLVLIGVLREEFKKATASLRKALHLPDQSHDAPPTTSKVTNIDSQQCDGGTAPKNHPD